MSKVKPALRVLGVLAVFVITAAATATASAEFKLETTACGSGTIVNMCWETASKGTSLKQLVGEEEFLLLLETGAILLLAIIGETELAIHCNDTVGLTGGAAEDEFLLILQPAPLLAKYTVDATLLFIGCVLEGTLGARCLVPVEKETTALTGTVEENENNILFTATGGVWIELPLTNNTPETCPATFKGTKKITGEQLCTWSSTTNPPLEALEQHLLICGASELLFAEQSLLLEAEYGIVLEHEPFWDTEET